MEGVKEIVEKQREFADKGDSKNVSFRIQLLLKLKKVLKENEQELNEAIYKDVKKSAFETYLTELSVVYHEIDFAVKNLKKWAKPVRVKTGIANFPASSKIIHEPLGTTLIIGAWNYPYQLVLNPAVAALAAGNAAILKPSELPSTTSNVLEKIINQNFDSSYLHVMKGSVELTTELLKYSYGKICFTGSTQVGKIIATAAAQTLTPTLLELGGKSPCFVFPDTNLKLAAKRIAWGKFINSGQTCIAPDYLYVHDSVYNEFLEELKIQTQLVVGPTPKESESFIRIINNKNFNRLKNLIDPAKIFYGGDLDEKESYISPTILKDVNWGDVCMQEEIFGPILPVLKFSEIDNAINEVKRGPRPLALYLFTSDKRIQDKILNEVSFGGGAINDVVMHFTNNYLPFGGVGQSGMGNYHGKHGFLSFSHQKSILKKQLWFEPSIKYAPYTSWKLKFSKLIFG
ncbi:aldehyde dehydrogenase (NAD) family protein [Bacteriovorax sp. BSW11_IV]|uniref:aldehyde dehydrogenase family protein n=1 Tax=Bacteriovorax sp. BSW11_IV TaxID=1353529 RepID=UPI000389F2DB|nr:aldehyde dehydrogenase family protein [Bacteriovorax sp. BSW11_IV]EQC45019.1 aldehyde dehydrogenase (NAD) family protein [Bacteriovorax sp. BSW11_IV]